MLSYFVYKREGEKTSDNVAIFNGRVNGSGALTGIRKDNMVFEIAITDIDPVRSLIKINSKFHRQNVEFQGNGSILLGSYKSVSLTNGLYYAESDVALVADGDPNSTFFS